MLLAILYLIVLGVAFLAIVDEVFRPVGEYVPNALEPERWHCPLCRPGAPCDKHALNLTSDIDPIREDL